MRIDQLLGRVGTVGRHVAPLRWLLNQRLILAKRRWSKRAVVASRALLAETAGRQDLRLNIGSSSAFIDGWINADLEPDPDSRCLVMDATERWPFADECAEAVNSEHFIEHVDLEHAQAYFREAFRVLRPGGVIRTSTPDLEGMARAYLEADSVVLEVHRAHGYTAAGHAELVNNYFYSWGHRHIYDCVTLRRLLEGAGFTSVLRASFGESEHSQLRGIDTHDMGELECLVVAVDAVKPG